MRLQPYQKLMTSKTSSPNLFSINTVSRFVLSIPNLSKQEYVTFVPSVHGKAKHSSPAFHFPFHTRQTHMHRNTPTQSLVAPCWLPGVFAAVRRGPGLPAPIKRTDSWWEEETEWRASLRAQKHSSRILIKDKILDLLWRIQLLLVFCYLSISIKIVN